MKPTVYVETTIVSYLAARPTRDVIVRAHQTLTRRWWRQRARFELFASPLVVEEAERGNIAARNRRRRLLRELPLLEVNDDSRVVGRELLAKHSLPAQAEGDGLHIAVAAVHGMEYLVTWNCRHIANAALAQRFTKRLLRVLPAPHAGRPPPQIEDVVRGLEYELPILCTPEELLQE